MGSEMFSSRVQEKMTIKSNFARTCNRFSQFLKDRRSFGELDAFTSVASPNFETKGDTDAYSARIQTKSNNAHREMKVNKSLDLFPLTSSSSTTLSFQESTKNLVDFRGLPKSREESKKTNTMTIIYEGEVLIFEDLQEEMAREIMSLASEGGKISGQYNASNTITTHLTHHCLSDLPIARRASLHRFMEKRKDRIAACAPYQPKNSSTSKELYKQQDEHHLELKLW